MEKLLMKWRVEGKLDDVKNPRARMMRQLREINDPSNHLDERERKLLREKAMRDFQTHLVQRQDEKERKELPPLESDVVLTYHNEAEGILGCSHYPKNCKIRCPECDRFSTCRVCHAKQFKHELNRFAVKTMYCMLCKTIGPVGHVCSNCKKAMSVYYCDICHIFTDPGEKVVFHCDKCGLCRVRLMGEKFNHCDNCDCCMAIDHVCSALRDRKCPVCNGDLFTSRKDILSPERCSHMMHRKCFMRLCQTTTSIPSCPICRKSLADDPVLDDISVQFDRQIASWTVPKELLRYAISFHCNDCEIKTENAPWNFAYRCPQCNHYNTSVVATRVLDDDEYSEVLKKCAEASAQAAENNEGVGEDSLGSSDYGGEDGYGNGDDGEMEVVDGSPVDEEDKR